ncbi:Gfo/Idh/MocA family oxidoreductase [Asanoa sp. NPDC050611]|uniref:Gfo/Idh/MocA family protein n=1 Tax=Asanoa sp. NPDC050611 TaxID=3157098 RepID=UPI0033F286A5
MRSCHIVLVGLGDIGVAAHLPALLREPRVEVTGLVDPDADKQRRAQALTGGSVASFGSLDDALATCAVDAVVLATPPWATTRLARDCLARGLYVLAEKPVATSVAAADVLTSLPPDVTGRLQVGLTFRHDPAMTRLREWLTSGRLGRGPLLVRAHIYDEVRDPADVEHTGRIIATLRHGSPVMHEGSHVFDWLAYLLGGHGVLEDAWSVTTDPALPAANLTGGRLRYADGTVVLLEFGWFTAGLPRCQLTFQGDAGLAVLDGATFRLELRHRDGNEVVEIEGDRVGRSFRRQLERFVDSVLESRLGLEPSLRDGIEALRTSAALEQRAGGAPAARAGPVGADG